MEIVFIIILALIVASLAIAVYVSYKDSIELKKAQMYITKKQKASNHYKRMTAEDIATIKDLSLTNKQVAKLLGRTEVAIYNKRQYYKRESKR